MSTVDYQTALDVATGKYPEDKWYSIIAYLPAFPHADITFKLCKDPRARANAVVYFSFSELMYYEVWLAEDYYPMTFIELVKAFRSLCKEIFPDREFQQFPNP